MKHPVVAGLLLVGCALSGSVLLTAQETVGKSPTVSNNLPPPTTSLSLVRANPGTLVVPKSSVPATTNGTTVKTIQANTNTQIFLPARWKPETAEPPRPAEAPPSPGYFYETPASFACIYSLITPVAGCNPNSLTKNPTGGKNAIAIVDAYDDPWAGPDLAYFSAQFGIPFSAEQFQVVYEDGEEPEIDNTGDWELEESTDIEMAHAMAPGATIYLVEAQSSSTSDLLTSVQIASNLISCGSPTSCPSGSKGVGEVSMSWDSLEFEGETEYDSYFTTPGVVYVASSGDNPGTSWPCVSPNVVCAGGTTIRRNPTTGAYIEQRTWELGGGGASLYEKTPSYQVGIAGLDGARGVPDVSLDSNPLSGMWIWDSNYFEEMGGGWFIVGGTSLATPTWAGIINVAGKFYANSAAELSEIYTRRTVSTDYTNILLGDCGPYFGYLAGGTWNPCTGVGTPVGHSGK